MRLNSGDTAPKSGSYKVIGKNGEVVNTVQMEKGDTLPPTQQSGWHYEIEE